MKVTRLLLPVFLAGVLFTSCSKDDDAAEYTPKKDNYEVEDFIYSSMDLWYLYEAEVPSLAGDFFNAKNSSYKYYDGFDGPSDLYEDLQIESDDFSFMTADYVALENGFSGISKTNGMQLALYALDDGTILAIVNYVLPNTSAEEQGIKRGDAFIRVDGQRMTLNIYQDLLDSTSYTITLSEFQGTTIRETEKTVTLNKTEYHSNPVYITENFIHEGVNVGYLVYNSFTSNYDEDLNNAFAKLKAAGVEELILDLRYNGGGSVATAVGLAGMITGQYEGEVLLKEQWNETFQKMWGPENYVSRFSNKITLERNTDNEREVLINSLGLNRVYVLTTGRSASASELVINGLKPYIDVIQIGETTTGKFQASVTLYDSPGMIDKTNINTSHNFAIQPLVFKTANVKGVTDYTSGLQPTIEVMEVLSNMGTLGDKEEPLLKAALNDIAGIPQDQEQSAKAKRAAEKFKFVGESGMNELNYQQMYIDNLPQPLKRKSNKN